jgi:hypothetical protein
MASCLTAADLISVRAEIGSADASGWDDSKIIERGEAIGSTNPIAVALSIVREKLADLRNNAPAQWSLSGDYSENWTSNIAKIEAQIARLEGALDETAVGGVAVATTGLLVPGDMFRLGDLD